MNYKLVENMEKYIDDIILLDHEFYDDKYLWTKEYQYEIFKRNPYSFIAVELNGKLVGYLNFLSLTKKKYDEMINSDIMIDRFNLEDIIPFSEDTYLTINSVVVSKKHQNGRVIGLINNEFVNKILNDSRIKGVNGIAISPDGNKWLTNLGFKHYKKLIDGNDLYVK